MIEKRRSKIQGWGVFATEPITKNKRIIDYAGEKIRNSVSLEREIRYLKHGHIWCFKLNRLYVRDAAVGGNIARYINHACEPNCYTQIIGDTIWIIAARNIRKGEELTYDYSTDGEGVDPVPLPSGLQGAAADDAIIYLHGFASSARSSKATFFAGKLREHGVELHTPDLNEPDFSTLTVTRMVEQVRQGHRRGCPGRSSSIGSSLGAFVAVQVALKHPARVGRLVLLAPALDFGGNRMRSLGDVGLEEWKRTGKLDVFHYGYGRMMPVHYELYADARRYDALDAALAHADPGLPGAARRRRRSRTSWSAGRGARPNVELHMLDDDHQLGGEPRLHLGGDEAVPGTCDQGRRSRRSHRSALTSRSP